MLHEVIHNLFRLMYMFMKHMNLSCNDATTDNAVSSGVRRAGVRAMRGRG